MNIVFAFGSQTLTIRAAMQQRLLAAAEMASMLLRQVAASMLLLLVAVTVRPVLVLELVAILRSKVEIEKETPRAMPPVAAVASWMFDFNL